MFNSELRKAADHSASLGLRITNLASAVGRFPVLGFQGTFDQLNVITGSAPGNWTSEQIDRAVELLGHARGSWRLHEENLKLAIRASKRLPGYRPLDWKLAFDAWRDNYFDPERFAEWRLADSHVLARNLEARRLRAERRATWLKRRTGDPLVVIEHRDHGDQPP